MPNLTIFLLQFKRDPDFRLARDEADQPYERERRQ